jgi:hypothetical protein
VRQAFDFLVIGSQKAGTTALHEYLRRHPELELPPGKEAPFYSHDEVYEQGWERYVGHHFARASDAKLWGSVSPQYMRGLYRPATPPDEPEAVIPDRIAAHSPGVKLIAVLREPVGRAYSHHRMQLMNGWDARPFGQAVRELLEPAALAEARANPHETNTYVTLGEYGRMLAPYIERFGHGRLLVLFHGELLQRPRDVLQRTLAFIGVDDGFVPDNLGERYRVGGTKRIVPWLDPNAIQARAAALAPLRAAWQALPARARFGVNRAYKELGYRIDLANRRTGPAPADDDAEARELLREHYAADRERLVALGIEPPW